MVDFNIIIFFSFVVENVTFGIIIEISLYQNDVDSRQIQTT